MDISIPEKGIASIRRPHEEVESMKILLPFIITYLGVGLGFFLDAFVEIKDPVPYWAIGYATGIFTMVAVS